MRRLLFVTLGLGLTAAALGGVLWLCGFAFRPASDARPPVRPPEEIAAINQRRDLRLDLAAPPRFAQAVNYADGSSAPWWPKGESPLLATLVRAGKLAPVAERTGREPLVLAGPEGVGRYGGDWMRLVNSIEDIRTLYWRLSYPALVRWSPQGYPLVPHIAKAYEMSPDGRVWTFHLREGMRWSDGAPYTADDLEYWYRDEVLHFQASPRMLRSAGSLGRVEKVDRLTVRFVFDQPSPMFLERLASISNDPDIFGDYNTPAHYLRPYHPKLGDPVRIAAALRASGLASPQALYRRLKHHLNAEHPRVWPWVYLTAKPEAPHVLVRNPYFFAVDPQGNQLPYLDRLIVELRPNNLIPLVAASGILALQDRHIRYEDHVLLTSEAARNHYTVYHWKSASASDFTLYPNLNRRVDPSAPETLWKHRLLNEDSFRQALSLAINRRDIIAAEYNGQTEPAQIEPGPDSPFSSPALRHAFVAYDPAGAEQRLDALGLARRDAEGFRTFPDGSRMTWFINLTEITGPGPVQFVVDDWARVGLRAVARMQARKLFETGMNSLEHDLTVWTSESEFIPLVEPRSFVPIQRWSSFAPGFGIWYLNGGLRGDPAAVRGNAIAPPPDHPLRTAMGLYDRIQQTLDPEERRVLFRRITDLATEHLWHISLSSAPPQLVVVKDGLRNVPPKVLSGSLFQTPGNAGFETWFWDAPAASPTVDAEVLRSLEAGARPPTVSPQSGLLPPAARGFAWLGWLFAAAAALALLACAVSHPFIGRRLLLMVPTLGVVTLIVFTVVQLPPGDFVESRLLELELNGGSSSAQEAAELRRDFRLDAPLAERYLRWVGLWWFGTFRAADTGLLQGNLGLSMEHGKPVNEVIGDRIVLTVLVSLATIVFTWLLALPIGIYSAVRQYSWGDYALTLLGFVGMSIPSFLFAVLVMWGANQWLGLKISGLFSPEFATQPGWSWPKVLDLLKHVWIPVLILGVGGTAAMIRVMRANLLDELRKPYVTTARAKGVRPLKLLLKYPVRLALNPFVSSLGNLFPQLVSGGAIVALVLSLPMVGPVMLDALLVEDIYLAGSMLVVLSLLGICGTLVSDLLLLWLDPRIRLEGGAR